MKHNVRINVSKKPMSDGVVNWEVKTIREKILRFLWGAPCKVMVLVPGDSVQELAICEVNNGGEDGE